jgi:hypothetical protein
VMGGVLFFRATQGGGADWARQPIQTPNIQRPTLGDLRHAPFIRDLPIVGN